LTHLDCEDAARPCVKDKFHQKTKRPGVSTRSFQSTK
jgi:hypothetical protein